MGHGVFGTAINCMDGRTQLPVNEFMRKTYHLDYVDTITEPGPIKILAENQAAVASIRQRVKVSVEGHGSRLIVVVAHYDCAGNPVSKEKQLEQLEVSLKLVRTWYPDVQCLGVWVDENWQVNLV